MTNKLPASSAMCRARRRLLLANGHPPDRARRQERNGEALADFVAMIVVRRKAVAVIRTARAATSL
jgi:hypothetical protein